MSASGTCNVQDRVRIVDDEFLIVMGLSLQVEDMGMEVCATAGTAEEAIALAQKHRPYIVLMDVRLQGDKVGVDAALRIHETVGSKVVFITGSREPATFSRIMTDYPSAVLFKPVSDDPFRAAIEKVRRI